jgi:hypothetical protein
MDTMNVTCTQRVYTFRLNRFSGNPEYSGQVDGSENDGALQPKITVSKKAILWFNPNML